MEPIFLSRIAKLYENADALYVLTAYDGLQGKNDDAMPFLQEANFEYLTGIIEPGWKVGIEPKAERAWLVMPERTEIQRIFDGGLSAEDAMAISGISEVIDFKTFNERLHDLADEYGIVKSLRPGEDAATFHLNPAIKNNWEKLVKLFKSAEDCRRELSALRAIKSEAEIELIKKAIDATIDAFERAKSELGSKQFEYQVEASFSYHFRNVGTQGHAYEPIVAASANACTLHYNANNDALPRDGLILMDVGAKVGGYAADITRTYAVNEATERQKQIHAAVEAAHKAIIASIKPNMPFSEYHALSDEIMKDALQSVGLLNDRTDEKTYRKYFPHAVSHGLGLDVHESMGGYKSFQPGMVLTVEPGIYINEEGIGVRIEDDILVTEDGNENLSARLSTAL